MKQVRRKLRSKSKVLPELLYYLLLPGQLVNFRNETTMEGIKLQEQESLSEQAQESG